MTREAWTKNMNHNKPKLKFEECDILGFSDKILNAYDNGYKQAAYEAIRLLKMTPLVTVETFDIDKTKMMKEVNKLVKVAIKSYRERLIWEVKYRLINELPE